MKISYHTIAVFCICFCLGTNVLAQVSLGARAPDFSLTVYDGINKRPQSKSLDSYKGRWLVLDFWSKTCSACINGFPKLSSLSQKYRDKVGFILIGANDQKYNAGIEKMYRKIEKASSLAIDNAFDTLMLKPYGVYALPHVVIIDPSGLVRAITFGSELTKENLDSLISGKGNNFAMNLPYIRKMPKAKITQINDSVGRVLYQSSISGWRKNDGLSVSYELSSGFKKGSYQTMASLERLYLIAYFGTAQWNSYHRLFTKTWPKVVFEMPDTNLFLTNQEKEKGYYNYRINFADSLQQVSILQKAMQQDLFRCFGFSPRIEQRNMPVYVLTAEGGTKDRLKSHSDTKKAVGDYAGASFYHYSMADVVRVINRYHAGKIIIDQSGISIPIDITLETNLTDFEQLKVALLKEGLRLQVTEKMVDVLVIGQKG